MLPTFNDTNLLGLDLSHYEPALNWTEAKDGGVSWMYTKASEGVGIVDQSLTMHISGAQAAGIPASAYHFFHASESGIDQADFFLHAIQHLKLDFPCILDWENASANGMSSGHQQAEASDWLAEVEKETGKTPIIYTGQAFMQELNLSAGFARFPLIIARYGKQATPVGPWKKLLGWQYTDALAAPGIKPGYHCDANVYYGTIESLTAL